MVNTWSNFFFLLAILFETKLTSIYSTKIDWYKIAFCVTNIMYHVAGLCTSTQTWVRYLLWCLDGLCGVDCHTHYWHYWRLGSPRCTPQCVQRKETGRDRHTTWWFGAGYRNKVNIPIYTAYNNIITFFIANTLYC